MGVSAAVYTIVHQDQDVTQQLVCAKTRLAKKNLTIPRLELVTGHEPRSKCTSSLKLPTTRNALLPGLNRSHLLDHGSDSTVALYWIMGQGES